jgi:hypothetical protein
LPDDLATRHALIAATYFRTLLAEGVGIVEAVDLTSRYVAVRASMDATQPAPTTPKPGHTA